AVAATAGAGGHRRALVHGASPGDELSRAGPRPAGAADAASLRVAADVPGDAAAAAGARAARRPARDRRVGALGCARGQRRAGNAGARADDAGYADAGGAAPVER